MSRMDEVIKAQWIDALRSGEYEQGRDRLTSVDEDGKVTHCCLGVLCDLAVKAGVDVEVENRKFKLTYDRSDTTLPESVSVWAGLYNDENPVVPVPTEYDEAATDSLAGLNDGGTGRDPWDFAQIADIIEANL